MKKLNLLELFNLAQFYRYIRKYDKALKYYKMIYDNPYEIIKSKDPYEIIRQKLFGFIIYRGLPPIEFDFPLAELDYYVALCYYKKGLYNEAEFYLRRIFHGNYKNVRKSLYRKSEKLIYLMESSSL